jgi:hypothetical protein
MAVDMTRGGGTADQDETCAQAGTCQQATWSSRPSIARNEARLLLAFDTHRAAIHAVAIATYKRERKGSYQLLAVDFYPRD